MKTTRYGLAILLMISLVLTCQEEEPKVIDFPVISTGSITTFTHNQATLNGNVTADGGAAVTERGLYFGTSSNPEISGVKKVSGSGTGSFSETVTGLSPNTKYYVKAYAVNSKGIGYGGEQTFTTLPDPAVAPTVETTPVTSFTASLAVVGGIVVSDGGSPVTEYGVYFGTDANPVTGGVKIKIGSGTGQFSEVIISLIANTKFYVRAYAINSIGTGYGTVQSFTTPQALPEVNTQEVTSVTDVSAFIRCSADWWGGTDITERGMYVSLTPNAQITGTKYVSGSGNGEYEKEITGLTANTRYYFRGYAINSAGVGLSEELTFRTAGGNAGCYGCETGSFTDSRDGYEYDWVKIGSQYWMAENLAWLPAVSPALQSSTSASIYYVYGYNGTDVNAAKATSSYTTYGVLYNWKAAMNGAAGSTNNPSGVQGGCPNGWHMPSNDEWDQLVYYLGGSDNAGYKMKSSTGWGSGNGDNSSKFNGLPAGSSIMGNFVGQGNSGSAYFWSATAYSAGWAFFKRLDSTDDLLYSGPFSADPGQSVRCVKD